MKPSGHDIERWKMIDALFDAALEVSASERAAFLSDSCGDDEQLRNQVEALLQALDKADSGFETTINVLGGSADEARGPQEIDRFVGPFRLLGEIGRGGMGVVYLAEDTRLGRKVALKALPPLLGMDDESRRRFVSEARAVSALDHRNIATLYEINATEAGQFYMAFAYYDGETLEQRVSRGPLPVLDAIEIATGLAAALAVAHESGIIHRDVKPSNVLLTTDGEVKLLDFGVAKVVGQRITREGSSPGTVAYMSPEQVNGHDVDHRSDLWSLGVVLYEMLAGRRPFEGDNHAALLNAIVHRDPKPLSGLRPELSEEVQHVVAKLLTRDQDGRYNRTDELLSDLEQISAGGAITVTTRPARVARPAPFSLVKWLGAPKWLVPALLAGLAVVAAAVWILSSPSRQKIERLAVLPLEDRSGAPDQQHFVDGIHDALIAELGKIGSIGVISRTSVMRYRDTEMSIPEIARELNVDAILEGSVLRSGDSVAVTAQLFAASPERQLWAESYQRGTESVLRMSSDVARSIADKIEITLSPDEMTRLTTSRDVNPAAFEAYTLGQFNLERRSREGFELAQNYLRRSIEIDSTFAPAYTALAEAYGSAAFFGLRNPSETMPVVRNLAQKALAIDSSLVDARVVLATVTLYADWDWQAAESQVRRAITANPSSPRAYGILSEVLAVQGRYQEALDAVERRSELERLVPFAAFRPVAVLYYMRDFDQAIERARAGLEFFSSFWQGHWLLCLSLVETDLYAEATTACEKSADLSRRAPMALGALGYVYARDGRAEDAMQVALELEKQSEDRYVGASYIAMVYAALGDHDRAFELLDTARRRRDVNLIHLANHAYFDPLRGDPRFGELVRDIGIPVREVGVAL